ncbi:3-deoxy-manno-octulosonate cytidylyltransferase, partial [bacterium]|nr:3-deoxy-manno-octulosonate cytidylyltransferase [bacterium]
MTHSPPIAGSELVASGLKLVIAIPARLGSTRLPRKPLAILGGKPLILRVAERVENCIHNLCEQLRLERRDVLAVVATDSSEIVSALAPCAIPTLMTASELPSGTDRILAAAERLDPLYRERLNGETLFVNLQGDEPFFHFEDIKSLVSAMLQDTAAQMGTLAFEQTDGKQFLRTSVVKVVCSSKGDALYFSRSPIPWPRDVLGASHSVSAAQDLLESFPSIPFLQHVGVYAYRYAALKELTKMKPSRLEVTEGLEQLRAIEAGWRIKVVKAVEAPFGIDTPEDLQR